MPFKSLSRLKILAGGEQAAFNGMAKVATIANTTYTLSTDSANPSNLQSLGEIGTTVGLLFDPTDGSLQNKTGRTITLTGSISLQPKIITGASPIIQLASARSSNKIDWTYNVDSHRQFEIAKAGESVINTTSFFEDVAPDDYIKFTLYAVDGTISLENRTEIFEGQSVTGFTILWVLRES